MSVSNADKKFKSDKVHSSKEVISSKDAIFSKYVIPEDCKLQPLDFVAEMPRFVPPNPLPINPPLVTDVNPPINN